MATKTLEPPRPKAEVHPHSPAAPVAADQAASTGIADVRSEFEQISRATPRDAAAEQAFIVNKIHMLMTQPQLDSATREAMADQLMERVRPSEAAAAKEAPP